MRRHPAGSAEDFYQGKTITLIVSNAAGGGYDIYARLLARYMPNYIPGHPAMVVQYMPGADGLVMANHMWAEAPRDGTTIGEMTPANVFQPLLGNSNAKFKAEQFTWLGTSSSFANDAYLLVVRSDSNVNSVADLRKPGKPLIFGGLAAGGTDTDIVLLARDVLKLNIKLIRGYSGSKAISLAMQSGEVQGRAIGMSSLEVAYADWLKQGKLNFLLQFVHEHRWARLPNVPTAREIATSPQDKALIELFELPFKFARPFIAPPKVPEPQATILKTAFMQTQKDSAISRRRRETEAGHQSSRWRRDFQKILVGLSKTSPN